MMVARKYGALAAAAILLFSACGKNAFDSLANKNSAEAKRIEAQMAIDNGNYAAAVTQLQAACPNNTCPNSADAQQLAAAYMGTAGLDTLKLLQEADKSSSSTATNATFATISNALPAVTATNLASINSAIQTLQNIQSGGGTLTSDQQLQLGIAQATAAVIAVGVQPGLGTTTGFDANGIPQFCSGTCTAGNTTPALTTAVSSALSAGTVTCTGTTAVTGTGTTFTTLVSAGGKITVGATSYTVNSVTNNTSLVLTAACSPTFSNATFTVSTADYVAAMMNSAIPNINTALGSSSSNTTGQSLNNLSAQMASGTCNATSTTGTSTINGTQITTYVSNCM